MPKKFKCGYCNKTFTLHNNFSNHVRKQHQGEQGKFACKICDFKTFDKFYLKKHISNHEEKEFPYQRGGTRRSSHSPIHSDTEDLMEDLDQPGPSKRPKSRPKQAPRLLEAAKANAAKTNPRGRPRIILPKPPETITKKTVVAFQNPNLTSRTPITPTPNVKIYNPDSDDSDEDDDYMGNDPENDPLEMDFNPDNMITLKVEVEDENEEVDVDV